MTALQKAKILDLLTCRPEHSHSKLKVRGVHAAIVISEETGFLPDFWGDSQWCRVWDRKRLIEHLASLFSREDMADLLLGLEEG